MEKFLLKSLGAATVVAGVAMATAAPADEPPMSDSAYIPKAMNEIFFSTGGSFNQNRSLGGQLSTMFGVGGFPEQAIVDDAYAVHDAYLYLYDQQARTDPTIRVPDLMNPYTTSVQFLPAGSAGMVSGSEFIFE